jgi:hypothetical protein
LAGGSVAELANTLNSIVIDAPSPDGGVSARVAGRSITVRFRPGAYARYSEERLAHQLAQLAPVAWAQYRRAYLAAVNDFLETPVPDDPRADDAPEREFRRRLETLPVQGTSPQGTVTVSSRGLVRWAVTIEPGTLRRLPEQQFLGELAAAVSGLLREHRYKVFVLRDEVFDLGMPAWYRRSIGLADRAGTRR